MIVTGIDPDQLAELRATLIDHGGHAVEEFVDTDGGWPLRCCLRDSRVGERLAVVAWCPFPWRGAYAETGPVVIHLDPCAADVLDQVPPQFEQRRQLVRPYTHAHRIAYDLVTIVEPESGLDGVIKDLLDRDDVERVVVRNVLAGCYSFTVTV